ncbi:MAG: aminoacyl-tRNA hydrolase [Lachnospiraceae bacterium]|nr:aminoacyl-tRNA hydrolase [Ruminococcus sp.]MCM1275735.1 aminoacyl-tRNA hydrolase [Lachnospiraceae bacterium]
MSVFDIFKSLESKSPEPKGAVEYIICGLGNPGTQYEGTRHNIGFMVVDTLCGKLGLSCKKLKFKSLTCDGVVGGKCCLIMKPTTFMNNSGEAVTEAMSFYKIPPERTIIVFDDISLEPGKLRIRRKGSDGGHNGIKSIIYLSGSDAFPRIKMGVGAKPSPDYDLKDWVLGRFKKEDGERLEQCFQNAAACLELMVQGKIDEAMNKYNS